ncbi:MAG: hypothetical protein WBP29_05010 [Candidatus Zixiibacteriota bacterium]
MKTLNNSQLYRQDFVDNAIFQMLTKLNPSEYEIEWNIESIGEIRDIMQFWLVDRLNVTDEMTFYPYIDTEP